MHAWVGDLSEWDPAGLSRLVSATHRHPLPEPAYPSMGMERPSPVCYTTSMRVAIVEDDPLLRGNLRLLLGGERDIDIVADYGSAEDALDDVGRADPEIMLVDIDLPGMSGIEFIRRVKPGRRHLEIMAFTICEDRDTVFAAIKAGASGYLVKGSTPRELVESLHMLHEGGAPMSPRIAKKILLELRGEPEEEQAGLTARERSILTHLRAGLSYREIAELLGLSPNTVHTHIKKTYEKLQAKGRDEALLQARRRGLL